MDGLRDSLRNGTWLTRERIRFVAAALLIASAAGFLWLVATAHGAVDFKGRPLGTDFSNVYAAGTYVIDGRPEAPFDPAKYRDEYQKRLGELLKAKQEGKEIATEAKPRLAPVVDMMEALKKSLAARSKKPVRAAKLKTRPAQRRAS